MPAADVLGLPAVLAVGAGVVLGTAALLSSRAAVRPELPTDRWTRRLPPGLAAVIDRRSTRIAVQALTLLTVVGATAGLVAAREPVDARIAVAIVSGAALAAGPLARAANPVRLLAGAPVTTNGATVGPPAVVWFAALSAVAVTTTDGRVLAVVLIAHLTSQTVLARRRAHGDGGLAWHDPVEALAVVVGDVAAIGRDGHGRLVWRNPIVSAAHASLPTAALWLTAVVAGLALATHAATPPLPTLALATTSAAIVLRLGIIRPYFTGAVAPVAAAYGLLAAGRWLAPLDLFVFTALHAVAVAVLHRQAIARHDPRTARAVQFPPRAALVASVLAGLTIFVPG